MFRYYPGNSSDVNFFVMLLFAHLSTILLVSTNLCSKHLLLCQYLKWKIKIKKSGFGDYQVDRKLPYIICLPSSAVLSSQHCHWYVATLSPSPEGSKLSWLAGMKDELRRCQRLWALRQCSQLAESWCTMTMWNGSARNRTLAAWSKSEFWSESKSTVHYSTAPQVG